ncbi:hypothetical protein, partial [Escherichia coli]|uniref:hypothetical protein n=1 Tax=Escherichia coli TaxID=562 RepID=UPI001CCA8F46
YELTIMPAEALINLPFGANVNATIIVNEADAVAVKLDWLDTYVKDSAIAWKRDEQGRTAKTVVTVAFITNNRAVVT